MTRDALYRRWEQEREHGRTPSYWGAVAALVAWDEDHPRPARAKEAA